MSKRGAEWLTEQIGKTLNYTVAEYDMTYSEVLNSLRLMEGLVMQDFLAKAEEENDG